MDRLGQRGDDGSTTRLRVTIGEDDVLLREGIARILVARGSMWWPGRGRGRPAAQDARLPPDVTIVDVQMPPRREDDGLRAAMAIRRREPGIGVLIVSQFCEPSYVVDLIGIAPKASATCSRNAWGTSTPSWTPWRESRRAAARSTLKW
jgi:DNA-binding NarL/FixJ family response regulator